MAKYGPFPFEKIRLNPFDFSKIKIEEKTDNIYIIEYVEFRKMVNNQTYEVIKTDLYNFEIYGWYYKLENKFIQYNPDYHGFFKDNTEAIKECQKKNIEVFEDKIQNNRDKIQNAEDLKLENLEYEKILKQLKNNYEQ